MNVLKNDRTPLPADTTMGRCSAFKLASAIALLAPVALVGCGGGGGGGQVAGGSSSNALNSPVNATSNGTIPASSIVLKTGAQLVAGKDGIIRVQANQLPDNVKVLASNVSIVNASNELTSSDLQTALDKEIAVNVSKAIVGVWDVQNFPGVATGCGVNLTGRVEFREDGTFTMLAGSLSAAREFADGADWVGPPPPSGTRCQGNRDQRFQLVHGGIYFQKTIPAGVFVPGAAAGMISAKSSDAITIFGSDSISHLTRVGTSPASNQNTQPVSDKPQITPNRSVVAMVAQS